MFLMARAPNRNEVQTRAARSSLGGLGQMRLWLHLLSQERRVAQGGHLVARSGDARCQCHVWKNMHIDGTQRIAGNA